MTNPFRYFNSSPEVIRLVVMMYVRYPLSLRNVEDLLAERGIDISHETVRFWWNRFGPMFAAEIRKNRVLQMRGYPHCGYLPARGFFLTQCSVVGFYKKGNRARSRGLPGGAEGIRTSDLRSA